MTNISISREYRSAIATAILLQVFLTLLLASLLDGGRLARNGGCAMIGFWLGAAWVVVRRPTHPIRTDVLYIRWGFAALLVITFVIVSISRTRS